MTVAVRVIPCLDIRDGKVTKGVKFQGNVDVGDPVELARRYERERVDELVFYDITASAESRSSILSVVRAVADAIFLPFTVGGGVTRAEDFDVLLRAGADKVSVNSGAVVRPGLIDEAAAQFGAQCVVLSVDARRDPARPSGFGVTTHGGRKSTGLDLVAWVREGVERGAGEIVVNSMDTDGVRTGYDLEMLRVVRRAASVPVVASGGAGRPEHFVEAVEAGADAVLAASVFHSGAVPVRDVKSALAAAGHPVR